MTQSVNRSVMAIRDIVMARTNAGADIAMRDGCSIEAVMIGRLGLTLHLAVDQGISIEDAASVLDVSATMARVALEGSRDIVRSRSDMADWFKTLSSEVTKSERGEARLQ